MYTRASASSDWVDACPTNRENICIPAHGLGDGDDHAHQGYQTFLGLLDKYQPKYMVHGHMHLQYDHSLQRTMQYNNTQIINAYEKHSWEY